MRYIPKNGIIKNRKHNRTVPLCSEWDIYGRLSKAGIDEGEKRIKIFAFIEEVFEWEQFGK